MQRTRTQTSDRRESWETDEHEPAALTPSGKRLLTANDFLATEGLRQSEHSEIRWIGAAPPPAPPACAPKSV